MKLKLLSSLVKVFPDEAPNHAEFTSFSSLQNEAFSFQLALLPQRSEETFCRVRILSPLAPEIRIFRVEAIPSALSAYPDHDDFYYDTQRTAFPDLLRPCGEDTVCLPQNEWSALWFTYTPEAPRSGEQEIRLVLEAGGEEFERVFTLDIIPARLPEQELLFTNWFHNDCLCTRYRVKPFSEHYWEIAENYIRNAASHGMNMILTPVFTPPLDTAVGGERPTVQLVDVVKTKDGYTFGYDNFEKYIRLCLSVGIKAFEISHLFTQWGALAAPKIVATVNGKEQKIFGWSTRSTGKAYTAFLTAFAQSFRRELTKLGIAERCWFHVSDEPSKHQLPGYRKAAKLIQELFPDFHTFDALSEIEFYRKGLVSVPVCGEQEAELFRPEVKDFWTYYCCGQTKDFLPNRLFAMPSVRNRVLGTLLYQYDAKGFLQWGHNFWYSQYSKRRLNPFTESDAGKAFPSGDAYVVYPGEDGKPLNSLRHIVFSDGFSDMRAMRLLEGMTDRAFVEALLHEGLDTPLTFRNYPHEAFWLLNVRQRINQEIKKRV